MKMGMMYAYQWIKSVRQVTFFIQFYKC